MTLAGPPQEKHIWRLRSTPCNVSEVDFQVSHGHPEFIAIHEEPNDDIMHLYRFRKADGLASQGVCIKIKYHLCGLYNNIPFRQHF